MANVYSLMTETNVVAKNSMVNLQCHKPTALDQFNKVIFKMSGFPQGCPDIIFIFILKKHYKKVNLLIVLKT